jgi:hypothetical protein
MADSCSQNNLALPKGPAGDNGTTTVFNTSSGQSILHTNTDLVFSTAVTTEETAEQITLDLNGENILNVDGDEIHIEGLWSFAANANTKTVRIYIGSSVAFIGTGVFNGISLYSKVIIKRTSATTQRAFYQGFLTSGSLATPFSISTLGENLATGSLIVKWTIQNGTAAANDIISNFRTVYKFKNV